jgi:protocatechuate 3,4-dioxygenase, alpha subunit
MSLQSTAWQTVGPYFQIGLAHLYEQDIAGESVQGQRIQVQGRVFDGNMQPISDAMLEIWQANANGKYAHPDDQQDKPLEPGFRGYGRVPTDAEGRFRFTTIKPGSVPGLGGQEQAPHLLVSLMMRGLLRRLVTRMYFPNEPLNVSDPTLQSVEPARRKTLLLNAAADQPGLFRLDIHMQGEDETVFLDI